MTVRCRCLVIQERHIRAAGHMGLQQILEILCKNPVSGCDDHIVLLHPPDHIEVVMVGTDVRIIDRVHTAVLVEQ